MASRSYRFLLRLAKDGIDHRKLKDGWDRFWWELEQRGRERREPQPRPRPYVDPDDHGEAMSAAIPRAPRFSAQALGTGAAAAHLHRWMLLSPLATVGDATGTELGGRVDFDILYQAPPRLSILHLHASVTDATAVYDVVSIDGDGGVLLIGVRYTDLARVRALSYLLCDTAARRATPVPTSLARRPRCRGRVGVVRRSDRVLLVEVEEGRDEARLRVIIFPDLAEPFVVETPLPPGAPRPWGSHAVVTHEGCIYFIDQTIGMIRFDPEDAPTLELILFPAAPAGQHYARYVGVTEGRMMLVEVDQAGRLRTYTFSEDEEWQPRLVITLPASHCFAFLHPTDAYIVYLLTSSGAGAGHSSIMRADMETGACTVEGRIPSASAARLITIEMH